MSFPRYPAYKASGVAWLGEVPAHWEIKQGRRLYLQNRDLAMPNDEQLSATQKYGVVPQRMFMELADQKVTLALSGLDNFRHVEIDDFVISLRSFQGGVERSRYSGCVSPAYTVLRPAHPIEADFMGYLFKSAGYVAALQAVTDGIREGKSISYEQFGQIGLPVPAIAEQRAIASFLDRETGKIDALVAEQEKLIGLLKEKRQAVISRAVTKGIDPYARMTDSGIAWLGAVPEHWCVKRIRFVTELNPSKSEIAQLDRDIEVSFLPMEAIGDDGSLNLERARPIGEVETGYTFFRNGDVVLAKITPCFENGKGAVMRHLIGGFGFGTTELVVVRPRVNASTSEYLHWLFVSVPFRKLGEAAMYGAGGQKRIPDDFVRNFAIAFPNVREQSAIAEFLERETAKLGALMAEAQCAIELLKERRSALISAAVTGKIDVRVFAEKEIV